MLMGEHAVLENKHALCVAIDKRIRVKVSKRHDDSICLYSELGSIQFSRYQLSQDTRFKFVLKAIETFQPDFGFDLVIESDFPPTIGFGSSAAVTVALFAALYGKQASREMIFEKSRQVIREVQGLGSGADVAASCFGGTIFYQMEPTSIEVLPATFPLSVIYSGSKMPTKEVVQFVREKQKRHPELFNKIYSTMDEVTIEAKSAIINSDFQRLGELMNIHHGLQEAIGTSNAALSEIVHSLRLQPGIFGAKISGSGLGDCAIGLGIADLPQIPVRISQEGVIWE